LVLGFIGSWSPAFAQNWMTDARRIAMGGVAGSENLASRMIESPDGAHSTIVIPLGLLQVLNDLDIYNPDSENFDPIRAVEYVAAPLHYTFNRNGTGTGIEFINDLLGGRLNRDINTYRGFIPTSQPVAYGLLTPNWGVTIPVYKELSWKPIRIVHSKGSPSRQCHLKVPTILGLLLHNCLRFNFNEHLRRNQPFYLDHDGGGPNLPKEFPMSAADLLPLINVGEVHPRLHDILERCSGPLKRCLDVAERLRCLRIGITHSDDFSLFICRSRPGNVNGIAKADRTGVPNDGFPLASGRDIISRHLRSFMDTRKLCWIGLFIGSTIGGYLPVLWGGDILSFTGIFLSLVGGLLGIWAGYRIGQSL